jgi:hypothetical protein
MLTIPVQYKGQDIEFPIQVVATGYTTKFVVELQETDVVFERDDSGEFRAMIPDVENYKGKLPSPALLEAIAAVLQSVS